MDFARSSTCFDMLVGSNISPAHIRWAEGERKNQFEYEWSLHVNFRLVKVEKGDEQMYEK